MSARPRFTVNVPVTSDPVTSEFELLMGPVYEGGPPAFSIKSAWRTSSEDHAEQVRSEVVTGDVVVFCHASNMHICMLKCKYA
jgi:hypothetical protein